MLLSKPIFQTKRLALLLLFFLSNLANANSQHSANADNIATENTDGFTLEPHRKNFFLPFSGASVSNAPYAETTEDGQFQDAELVFQLSVKYLLMDNFIVDDLDFYAGFTSISWWQAYNAEFSRPFRETNYQPELIFTYKRAWQLLGATVKQSYLSLNHQSNGQSGLLSRSWNRVIGGLKFQPTDGFKWEVQGWWRIPESDKDSPEDPDGDDNPNIERYLGYGQLDASWRSTQRQTWSVALRHNLRAEQRGAIALTWTKSIRDGASYRVSYFNGYGDGLIFYNESVQRLSLGFEF